MLAAKLGNNKYVATKFMLPPGNSTLDLGDSTHMLMLGRGLHTAYFAPKCYIISSTVKQSFQMPLG